MHCFKIVGVGGKFYLPLTLVHVFKRCMLFVMQEIDDTFINCKVNTKTNNQETGNMMVLKDLTPQVELTFSPQS